MRKVFIIFATVLFTNISFAELKPIPTYAGDDPWMPNLSRWGEIQSHMPRVETSEDKAKLADYKRRFKNGIKYLDEIEQESSNSNKYQSLKDYEKVMKRFQELDLEITKNGIYDRELLMIQDNLLRKLYNYYTQVYKEKGGEFIKRIELVNYYRNSQKANEIALDYNK